ncbi:hypothetical protein PMAYCL1PPCAC_00755, partial [Pristionchus mayeri]
SPVSPMPAIAYPQPSEMNEPLEQAHGYFAEEEHSDASVIILHMSELLSSYVREDPPEKRAEWVAALAQVRNSIETVHAHEELRFITDFSHMLEDGLQCIAEKCARLEQAVKNAQPCELNCVYRRPADAAAAATYPKWNQHGPKMTSTMMSVRMPQKAQFVACDLCTTAVPRLRYANHLRHEHPEEFEKAAKFRCSYCETALFIKEAAFKAHLESCHVRLEHMNYVRRLPHSDQLTCRMCSVQCGTLRDLAEHADKEHPHCQILSCTGCSALFRHPDAVIAHWKEAREKYTNPRCVDGALGTLVTRTKLVGQMVAHVKATGNDKSFTYADCMTQNIRCMECGFVVDDFKKIYAHVHTKHKKEVQSSLMFGCLGCTIKYRCAQGLRDHLFRSEIEKVEECRNAGAVYWDETLISKDKRPSEASNEEMIKSEEITLGTGDWSLVMTPKKEEEEVEGREEKKKEGKWEAVMKDDLKMKIKRTPIVEESISVDSMDVDAGFNSMDDMPSLEHFK